MDRKLWRQILKAIFDMAPDGGHTNFHSSDVYQRLVRAGVNVPDDAMREVLEDMQRFGIIRGPGSLDPEGAKRHGAISIMWVSPAARAYL